MGQRGWQGPEFGRLDFPRRQRGELNLTTERRSPSVKTRKGEGLNP